MSDSLPDLTLVLRQQKQMLDEFADFRDQLTVLTAICMRLEGSLARLQRRVTELVT